MPKTTTINVADAKRHFAESLRADGLWWGDDHHYPTRQTDGSTRPY